MRFFCWMSPSVEGRAPAAQSGVCTSNPTTVVRDASRCDRGVPSAAVTPALTQQGEPVVKVRDPAAQPLGSSPAVRHQRHDSHAWHRFGFYYYSTALLLITNDGYEDP